MSLRVLLPQTVRVITLDTRGTQVSFALPSPCSPRIVSRTSSQGFRRVSKLTMTWQPRLCCFGSCRTWIDAGRQPPLPNINYSNSDSNGQRGEAWCKSRHWRIISGSSAKWPAVVLKQTRVRFFSLHHTFHIISKHTVPNNRRSCHSAHGTTLCIHNKSRNGLYSWVTDDSSPKIRANLTYM